MQNIHNSIPEENNQEPSKFPWDFLGRYKDGIVVGRTREVDGIKIYEVSEDIRHGTKESDKRRIEISEEEHVKIKQEYEKEDQRLKEKEALEKKLKKIGAIHEIGYGDSYINLLFSVLDEHQIVTLEEISEQSRQQMVEENTIDYSYPFDNPLIGARSYTKDGAILYEIQEPLSDDYYLVTAERYEQFITQRKDIRNKEREKAQEKIEKHKKLEKLGYHGGMLNKEPETYQEQLISTLEESNISHIKEIPNKIKQNQKEINQAEENIDQKNTSLELFQSLTKLKHTPDIYEQEIIAHLEKCEEIIKERYIDTYGEDFFLKIAQLFSTGYIKNLELFYRFEKLKKQNIMNHCKKLYTYGSCRKTLGRNKYGSRIEATGYNAEESTSINQNDFDTMIHLLYTNGGTIADLGVGVEAVLEKVKNGYKNRRKDFFLGKEFFAPNPKYNFTDLNFKRLDISSETKVGRQKEAEAEFINEFGTTIEKILDEEMININDEGKRFLGLEKIGVIIARIQKNMENNPENDLLQKHIGELLYQKISILIQRIEKKEKIEKIDWQNKRNLSYKVYIQKLGNSIDILYKGLKSLNPILAEQTGREQNKDIYINEYKEFFRTKFINKRNEEFAKMDLTDTDAVKQKIIQDVKVRFYKHATKRGKRRAERMEFNDFIGKDETSSRGNKGAIMSLIGSFFETGHALLLKTLYPNNRERKIIRRVYIQQIIEELISEIQNNLINIDSFKWEEYFVVRPMLHVYKKYGGTKDIFTKNNEINNTIHTIRKNDFEKFGYQRVEKIKNYSSNQTDKDKYASIHDIRRFMRSYISYFAQEKGINLKLGQNIKKDDEILIKEKNLKRSTIATESCIDDLSYFGADIDELEKKIDQDIFNMILDMYNQIDIPAENIMNQILENRFTRNTKPGGKLQRIIEDSLKRSFGSINLDESQIESIFNYLDSNLVGMILEDLIGPDQDIQILERDQRKINKYILEYIEHLKKKYKDFKALE